jgi:hypothetical protein
MKLGLLVRGYLLAAPALPAWVCGNPVFHAHAGPHRVFLPSWVLPVVDLRYPYGRFSGRVAVQNGLEVHHCLPWKKDFPKGRQHRAVQLSVQGGQWPVCRCPRYEHELPRSTFSCTNSNRKRLRIAQVPTRCHATWQPLLLVRSLCRSEALLPSCRLSVAVCALVTLGHAYRTRSARHRSGG